jgi:hypothetical protein
MNIHQVGYMLLGVAYMTFLLHSAFDKPKPDWFGMFASVLIPAGVICVAWII